jgi:hypothetical protein
MKPTPTLNEARCRGCFFARRLPITDYNFQPPSLVDLGSGHGASSPAPSFRSISRDYFRKEARHNFVIEAFLFAGTVFGSAVALVISALAAIDFLRALGYF